MTIPSLPQENISDPPPFPDYPNACTLLISAQRTHLFFERTARELLAGGTTTIILSALGDAIGLGVRVALLLVEKKAATIEKIKCSHFYFKNFPKSPCLRILIIKNPDYKGSRIPPAHIRFALPADSNIQTFLDNKGARQAIVLWGESHLGGQSKPLDSSNISHFSPYCQEFLIALQNSQIDISQLENAINTCYEAAIADPAQVLSQDPQVAKLRRAHVLHPPKESNNTTSYRLVMCRPGLDVHPRFLATGTVVAVALQNHYPNSNASNAVVVYVATPARENYPDKDLYCEAVKATAQNLMVTLCDFNGIAHREGSRLRIRRIGFACIFPLEAPAIANPDISTTDLAQAVIEGLDAGYCHGPSPRLLLANREDVFQRTWVDVLGLARLRVPGPKVANDNIKLDTQGDNKCSRTDQEKS